MNNSTNIIIGLIDGKFESLAFFVSVFEDFLFLFFIKDDVDIDITSQPSEEAGNFFLNQKRNTMWLSKDSDI
jgi:hypothetical protein